MRIIFHLPRLVLLLFVSLTSTTGSSQSLYPPKVQSPVAASLGTFGEVPVNTFTGVPNISIPIHTLTFGRISVPIALRYHASSVKPSQQPGWVGSGWDLECSGSISRQVRGGLDEFYIHSSTGNATIPNSAFYYPFPGQTTNPGAEYANLPNWSSQTQLVYDFTAHPNFFFQDVEADEFSFNVMGHSGKFYYSGAAKGWEVVSEENIKVEVTGFYEPGEIITAIKRYDIPDNNSVLSPSPDQPRSFGGFILTVPDGTRYFFGGKTDGLPEAVEFSCPRTTINPYIKPVFTANTWLLTRIVDADNNEITFSYTRKYPTCNLYIGFYELNASCYQNNVSMPAYPYHGGYNLSLVGSSGTYSTDHVNADKRSGVFQWPMYLTSVQSPNESVNFTTSNAICRRYSNDQLSYIDVTNHTTNDIDNSILGLNWPANLEKLQWLKLDKIVVKDNMHNSNGVNNYNANIIRQFQLNYSNSPNQRLTLNSLSLVDKDNSVIGQYSFNYNSGAGQDLNTTTTGIDIYADGNYTDHWGFYNNTDIGFTQPASLFFRKEPNQFFVTAGLLNKITYPTGGYTSLTWEANDYSRIVALNRQAPYVNSFGYGGGCRIAQIKSYTDDGTLALQKKYYYKKNYAAGANPDNLPSSGVLNGKPQYMFLMINRIGILGGTINDLQSTSFNSVANYSYTGQGAPVGYDEVVEVNADGSYTKNVFTSYDTDMNGVSHWDNPPAGYLGWSPSQDTYFPRASLESERGKPVGTFIYSSNNILLKKTNIIYRNDAARFTDFVKLIDLNGSYGSPDCADALVLATARPVYKYSYYPVSTTITTYDQMGNNPMVQTTTFTYNNNNLVKTKTETNSRNETIVTTYSYPNDYSDATSQAMVTARILSPVVQETVVRSNNSGTIPIRSIRKNYFQPYTGLFVPLNAEIQIGPNPAEIREQVTKYDSRGNILEIQKPNDVKEVYIRGCNSQYIMAKIVGSDYNTASALIDQSKLDQAGVGYNNYSDLDIRNELKKLRDGLPNALVTTYTYKCGVGLATVTDPNGITSFYVYDGFGRLSMIIDKDNNILKKYCYNYWNQPENCTSASFGNDPQQASFTKSGCPAGTVAPTYSYTVPADTYTSFISKENANEVAIEAMNRNGQAAANALPCLAGFTGTNNTSIPWNITLAKTDGSFNQTYSLYPNQINFLLANIPIGQYNISITYMYSPANSQLLINGTTYTGTTFNLSNLDVSSATSFTLQNAPGSCSFSMSMGYTNVTSNLSSNGSTASFYLVFYRNAAMTAGNTYGVATINGSCRPSATRTINYSNSGRNWTITIYPSGQMLWYLAPGSTPVSPNQTVSTSTLSYNL